jgi:acyl transferase domain-containing protein/NAD(P)-dependent dehydrogenase (short-subunit alcohol dehydrogenase family)/NAD(P)H-dependent flavin oxidoreductase YrpB (nitropropane dioxygenase family)/acyl carrier protein
MTRVSDRPSFAAKVAQAGALPFLALGTLRAPELKSLFEETQHLLGKHPWGVGILGFVPMDLRQEQLEVIRAYHPPFALIAGGHPDQARTLEQEDIPTYLHVPSPGLLKMFLENGARRFVFEGRECGGHIGPRSSFVLWNLMIEILLEALPPDEAAACHVLFAGGIHDALSSAMVATLAAPLADRGISVGVLLGTAYLFTEEAVATGAIVKRFQKEAVRCCRTMELETGPGHITRCAATPYTEAFHQEKQRLLAERKSPEEVQNALEALNLGRLRIAAKGVARHSDYGTDPQVPKHITVEKEEQYAKGLYMIGQVSALRDQTCTIKNLHDEISVEGSQQLSDRDEPTLSSVSLQHPKQSSPSDIAIIGMSCMLPKAPDCHIYWENILNKVDAITEVPEDRWDWKVYYDPDPKKRDKIYSKWGGFLDAVPFDPMRYGMPPNTLPSIEPLQLLTLEAVHAALENAGYADRPFARERTSVILGVGGGIADLGQLYAFRSNIPIFFKNVSPEVMDRLPEWTEDSFPGVLLNVTAGRVANRFDLGGVNYTVDAACASSLAAVYLAVSELENRTSDMIIVGGADSFQNPFGYLCFSKTQALSPTGHCRTFDESNDGTVISEGVAVVILKRLADAEQDGDRIYAVIKAVGASSDGRDKGLSAPRPEGQKRSLGRAYSKAGFTAATVDLVEAHGTGTVAGDRAEIETLKQVFEAAGTPRKSCALGSVKSMIGHTKCTAGVAGLIKITQALYHKVLPPTIGVTEPNSSLAESPFYVNTEARPWFRHNDRPLRAGVSAFGFGGSNFHALLEEYTGNFLDTVQEAVSRHWLSELFIFKGQSHRELLANITSLDQALTKGAEPALSDLAYTLWQEAKAQSGFTLAVVATSLADLSEKLGRVRESLSNTAGSEPIRIHDPRGTYFTEKPLGPQGQVAFLFPGQGSQYPNMLVDLAIQFREVTKQFEIADRVLTGRFPRPLSTYVFPPSCFSEEEEQSNRRALTQTNVTQPAIGAANMGLLQLLQSFGIRPHMVAGHSYGEFTALCAAGVFADDVLYTLSETRGRLIMEAANPNLGKMAAVEATPEYIGEVLDSIENVWIANLNAPKQTIISGSGDGVDKALQRLKIQGIRTTPIQVSCAFHSPLMSPVQHSLAEFLGTVDFAVPKLAVFSNTLAKPYPQDPKAICNLLSEHLIQPVKFSEQIGEMYQAGARIFIEVGPRNVLTSLTEQILDGRSRLTVALDIPGRSSFLQLQHALAQLATHGVPIQLDRLYQGRQVRQLNLKTLVEETRKRSLPATTWMIEGGKVMPLKPRKTTPGGTPPDRDSALFQTKGREERTSDPSYYPQKPESDRRPIEDLANRSDPSEIEQVMLRYQQMMGRFLEAQRQVILTYLGNDAAGDLALPNELPDPAKTSKDLRASPFSPSDGEFQSSPERPVERPTGMMTESLPQSASVPVESFENEPPAEAVPVEASAPQTGKEALTTHVLEVVSERTGYPPEMLDLDLNLEADLGIDSIKRVEIFGILQKSHIAAGHELNQEAMEELRRLKTLRSIIDWYSRALGSQSEERADETIVSQQEAAAKPLSVEPQQESDAEVPRFVLTAVEAPPLEAPLLQIPPGALLLITDDEMGVAQSMADQLRSPGGQVALVRMGDQVSETAQGHYAGDMTNPEEVASLLELIRRRQGAIGGIIHLLALRGGVSFEEMSFKDWQQRLRLEAKSLFNLTKAAGKDLRKAAESGAGWLMAATAMGGNFAADIDESPSFFPGQGAIVGLVKTLAVEWPEVRCKAVDLDPAALAATSADHLLREMADTNGEVEVSYRNSRRLSLKVLKKPLDEGRPDSLALDSSWVVLVTGGARGITAEVTLELARRYQPTLLLVGRSALPEEEESPETTGLTSPQELKAALIDKIRRTGKKATPAQVEAAFVRVNQDREIRNNIKAMREAGSTVHYYQVDVRDEENFSRLLDKLYENHRRLDGVIHGAGIIEDKLLEDKTPDSFDRVFDTKVDSAFILSRKLRGKSLRALVFFSSVAGRFGNRGQSDYVAANEVINKLAVHLDLQWPGRVVAINWGPWAKAGMVSAEVQRQFMERGVQLVQPSAGSRMFDREIRYGRKGQVEVIIGSGPWETEEDACSSEPYNELPLLNSASIQPGNNGVIRVIRTLDPAVDQYLQDHRLNGKPVFPAAMAAELIAEVGQQGWPDWEVTDISDLKVLKGIVLEGSSREIQIIAQPKANSSQEDAPWEVDVNIVAPENTGRPFYRATLKLEKRLSPSPSYNPQAFSELHPFPMTVDEAYGRWLFHGPSLQGIREIEGFNAEGICAVVQPSSPGQCLSPKRTGQWLIDPVLFDCAFQLAILWARANFDMTAIPAGFKAYRRYRFNPHFPLRCHLRIEPSADKHILLGSIQFYGADGHVFASVEGMEFSCSKSLNRFVGFAEPYRGDRP